MATENHTRQRVSCVHDTLLAVAYVTAVRKLAAIRGGTGFSFFHAMEQPLSPKNSASKKEWNGVS